MLSAPAQSLSPGTDPRGGGSGWMNARQEEGVVLARRLLPVPLVNETRTENSRYKYWSDPGRIREASSWCLYLTYRRY